MLLLLKKKEKKWKSYSQKCNTLNPDTLGIFFMQKIIQNIFAKCIGCYINLLSYVYPKKAYALAYTLFSNPRKGKFKAHKLSKTLSSAVQEKHSFEEHVFHTYTWKGNEDTLLLS